MVNYSVTSFKLVVGVSASMVALGLTLGPHLGDNSIKLIDSLCIIDMLR